MATILHIDPHETTQNSIQVALGQQHNIITAADSSTAIQYCAMLHPDLILLNGDLTDIDARALTLRLKMFVPQTPIVILMPPGSENGHAQVQVAGLDGQLFAPFDAATLPQKIQTFLPKIPQSAQSAQFPLLSLGRQAIEQFEAQIAALNQANNRLASLNAISALIGTSLDIEHLMDEVLHQIQKSVNFDSATLFLLKGEILDAAASRGFSEFQRGLNIYGKSEQNSAWRVVSNKLPMIIQDVRQSPFWEHRPELKRVLSWLGVPLIYKERVVGVLTLDKNETDAFSDADARFVFTLAYQIAVAVENAQLFEEWEKQATRLKLINELDQEITTILDVNTLFDTLAKAIFERLHYDRVLIFEPSETDANLVLKACYGHTGQLAVNTFKYKADQGFIGRAIKNGGPIVVNDITQVNLPLLPGMAVQSILVIPVFIENKVVAVIYVDSTTPNSFGDHDLWTLSSLGTKTATVIENARLYQNIDAYAEILQHTVEARTRRLEAIKTISHVVSQGLGVDELLAVVGHSLAQIFAPLIVPLSAAQGEGGSYQVHADAVKVAIGLVNGSTLLVRTIYGGYNTQPESYKLDYKANVGQVIKQAKSTIVSNILPAQLFDSKARGTTPPANTLILAPLITAGKTIGVIMVESSQPDAFNDDDLETLESVAFQVAGAIEHARLLQKTKELAIVDERTRLARDMHDGVAQNLAYLLIQVDRCLNMVATGSKLESQLEQIGSLLEQNIDELRRNIFDLRPIALEGKTLFEVLENFVTEFGRRWNLQTTCLITGQTQNVSTDVESSLYRILQETLSNIRKHANCTQVSVTLSTKSNQWIILEIEDNGQGFNVENPYQQRTSAKGRGRGLGLVSMRERVEGIGGRLTLESTPGQGTRIFAMLPLPGSPTVI